jgi:hypothetical protein
MVESDRRHMMVKGGLMKAMAIGLHRASVEGKLS